MRKLQRLQHESSRSSSLASFPGSLTTPLDVASLDHLVSPSSFLLFFHHHFVNPFFVTHERFHTGKVFAQIHFLWTFTTCPLQFFMQSDQCETLSHRVDSTHDNVRFRTPKVFAQIHILWTFTTCPLQFFMQSDQCETLSHRVDSTHDNVRFRTPKVFAQIHILWTFTTCPLKFFMQSDRCETLSHRVDPTHDL